MSPMTTFKAARATGSSSSDSNAMLDGSEESSKGARIAVLGNPNTGKTTLFNRLCGLRAHTANFPGITVDARVGRCLLARSGDTTCEGTAVECNLVDLPGVYQLSLDLPETDLCRKFLGGEIESEDGVAAALIVVDATNLARNLRLVAEVREAGHPVVVALNMIDLAQRRGLSIDSKKLSGFIGGPVVSVCAKTGEGVEELRAALVGSLAGETGVEPDRPIPEALNLRGLIQWADEVVTESVGGDSAVGDATDSLVDRLDAAFTHPILGILLFGLVMGGLFSTIFWVATFPMNLMGWFFDSLAVEVAKILPAGAVNDLLADGIIRGVGSVVVFLPQICLLFFLISILEDTGYLARAAFVMDRLLCRFGLPGQAFIPLLSSHACAIPGIMATKLIPDRNDRLATILVAPFMSCSARMPIYILLTAILFGTQPLLAGFAFFGCYVLGAVMAMISALIARRTILPGRSRPMVLELPTYKMPLIRSAVYTTIDRATVFLKNAGTMILAICVVLWWLSAYPKVDPPAEVMTMRASAETIQYSNPDESSKILEQADRLEALNAQAHSFIARLGHFVEPVFEPVGYDWKLSVGVLSSFAAREVFVSTMGILISGSDEVDVEDSGFLDRFSKSSRDDGSPVFTTATSASLLVFYVLAMQCMPTMVMVKRETGSWKWVGLQWIYMSGMAYLFALAMYHGLHLMGVS